MNPTLKFYSVEGISLDIVHERREKTLTGAYV